MIVMSSSYGELPQTRRRDKRDALIFCEDITRWVFDLDS